MDQPNSHSYHQHGPRPATEPGPETDRLAPPAQLPAYRLAGALLLLPGVALVAWIIWLIGENNMDLADFAERVVFNESGLLYMSWGTGPALGPAEWALAVALPVVGTLALLGRRSARGGVLALGFLIAATALRQGYGALEPAYRHYFSASNEGPWLTVTLIAAFLSGGLAVALMLGAKVRSTERKEFSAYAASTPADPRRALVGGLTLGAAAVAVAVAVDFTNWWPDPWGPGDLLQGLIDPAFGFSGTFGVSGQLFYLLAIVTGLSIAAVLHIAGRPAARGALLTLLPIYGYLHLRVLLAVDLNQLDAELKTARGTWWFLALLAVIGLVTAAVLLLLSSASRDRHLPAHRPPPWAAPPPQEPGPQDTPPGPQDSPPPGWPRN